tara:strand:- start:38 stop:469 length:432 start_codon:yes stop_codon:yes gene_type:complete
MATASRKRTVTAPLAMLPAPTESKGMLALAVSTDLESWERREELFWAPDTSAGEFEVPDLFEWNDRWYLTYTTYMESTGSFYRISDSVEAHGALLDSIASATSLLRGEDCRRGGGPVCLCIRPGGKVESRYPTGGFGADDVGS